MHPYGMKQRWFTLLLLFALGSCAKENATLTPPMGESSKSSRIVLLQVDYQSYQFEGGKELIIPHDTTSADSIPISADYQSPGDFGKITLQYQPGGDTLFAGTIVWMGLGERSFPDSLDAPGTFATINSTIPLPDSSRFQPFIFDYSLAIDYQSIWTAVNDLEVVSDHIQGSKKVGLFLYRPSVGMGHPSQWDWYVILNMK